jgi:hypothetical protein
MGIVVIFAVVLDSCALKIHWHKAISCDSPSRRLTRISLATSEIQEDTSIFFSFDSNGLPFVINNSATCIICNDQSQFVGNLQAKKSSVETTHGSTPSDYIGTILLTITTNDGEWMQYHIPNAIYDLTHLSTFWEYPSLESFWGETTAFPHLR